MRKATKEYFEEVSKEAQVEGLVLKKIYSRKVLRWKAFSLFVLFLSLFFLWESFFNGYEYKTMSAGVEVVIDPQMKVGELEKFLKDRGLYLRGPLPDGGYLLEAQRQGVDPKESIKGQKGIRPRR